MTPAELRALEAHLTPEELAEYRALLAQDVAERIWTPLPGPQTMAYESKADVIGYGGAAGGGKSEIAIGKALMHHHEVMIMRRESTQLQGLLARLETLLGTTDGYNSQSKVWRNAGPRRVKLEFGSVPNLGDETKYQGRPHDLLVFDEAANFLEQQVLFLMGWNRSTREGVHSQTLMTFNPPTSAEGRWIVDFFGPWIDIKHPLYPTAPGLIHYQVSIPQDNGTSRYVWVKDATQCVIKDGELVYDFDPDDYTPEDIVTPKAVTFIPSKISDNPYLANSGYLRVLQAMPEPLRSQMLYGDFQAGMSDDPWQVCPTAWVDAAMARWKDRAPKGEQVTLGVDVARGGKDNTTLAMRYRNQDGEYWFDKLAVHAGKDTPDGQRVAGLVIAEHRHDAPIMIDVIGVGAAPYDILKERHPAYAVNVAEKAHGPDRTGALRFYNRRSELWWKFRELLDPQYDSGIALPPDKELRAELCAPRWEMTGTTIKVESREDIIERVGRSPDRASAVIMAAIEMPKRKHLEKAGIHNTAILAYDPYASLKA